MTEEHRALTTEGPKKEFSIVRKGYDPAEVEHCLAEYEEAFGDLEMHAARLNHELNEARLEITRLEAAQSKSIDSAMAAVFAAKDRILEAAKERARRIEEGADGNDQPPSEPSVAEADRSDEPAMVAGEADSAVAAPDDVMERMLLEAEQIRNRLDSGLAAAFDQMETMQKDAEIRARELLAEARLEAARLRSSTGDEEVAIEVSLTEAERPSRYSRQSAALPRLTEDDGESVLAEMADLRARFRSGDESLPSHDAAG